MASMDLSGFEVPVLAHLGLSFMGGPGGLARRVAEPTIPAWGGRCTSEVAPAHRSVSGDLPRHGHAERAHWRTHSAEHGSHSRATFAVCTLMSRGMRRTVGAGGPCGRLWGSPCTRLWVSPCGRLWADPALGSGCDSALGSGSGQDRANAIRTGVRRAQGGPDKSPERHPAA